MSEPQAWGRQTVYDCIQRNVTCQHCQTWILDDDHRCRRCGRRVRNTPSRISPNTYPIAAAATARAYEADVDIEPALVPLRAGAEPAAQFGQQPLFSVPLSEPRVIPFDSLTTQTERESIRARAAGLLRPAPLKSAKVEVRHARPRKARSTDQTRLDFLRQEEVLTHPGSNIICDAPVAPSRLRMEAAAIDAFVMALACSFGAGLFALEGGPVSLEKQVLPFLALALMTVPILYKVLWAFAGRDTVGMRCTGLRLIDFDGNPPPVSRRYQRLFASMLSVLAAGVGLIWCFVDEDSLTWHDHISGTFPTVVSET